MSGVVAPSADRAGIELWTEQWWSPDLRLRQWWGRLADSRLAFAGWPEPWGLGWSREQVAQLESVFIERRVLGPPIGLGTMMGGPIVLEFGTTEQQERWLPGLIRGDELWCQMFSEPDAGSDLAGLTTTAERDGDEWVVNGQKVWTSLAPIAQRAMLVARTDWNAPKHKGLSYFILDMNTPGIEVRPLRQMNGSAHFNEVFLSDVRIPATDMLGDHGQGWAVAVSTLAHERRNVPAVRTDVARPTPGLSAGNLDRTVGEVLQGETDRSVSPELAGTAEGLIDLARRVGRIDDPRIRQMLAQQYVYDTLRVWSRNRYHAEAKARGGAPGPETSVIKLARTQAMQHGSDLAFQLLGPFGTLDSGPDPQHRATIDFCLTVPSKSIAGGTDEIQRNLVAERALGLPKEPGINTTSPFRDVPRNGTT